MGLLSGVGIWRIRLQNKGVAGKKEIGSPYPANGILGHTTSFNF